MKHILLAAACIFFFSGIAFAQAKNEKVKDTRDEDKEIMIGYCDRQGMLGDEFGEYFEMDYNAYEPSAKSMKKLSEKLDKVDITIVFGSWCSDSQTQLPLFYKILDEAGYDESRLKIIGVDREKKAVSFDISDLSIELVPTFIVYQNGDELGRIIETPEKTLEKDLAKIVETAD